MNALVRGRKLTMPGSIPRWGGTVSTLQIETGGVNDFIASNMDIDGDSDLWLLKTHAL